MAIKLPAGKKKDKKAVAVPDKKTMNFVHKESSVNLKKIVPVVLCIILGIGVFAKFGILDQLNKKTAAYADLAAKQEQLAVVNAKLEQYDALANQYGRYSYGWMSENEIDTIGCMDAIDLVQTQIMYDAIIENFSLSNNVLTLNLHGITLERASAIVNELERSDLVESASIYSADAEDGNEAKIFMNIVLTKHKNEEIQEEQELQEEEVVTE